jgi:LysM repeat protein
MPPPQTPLVSPPATSTVLVLAATHAPASPTPAGSAAIRATATLTPGSHFYEVDPGDTLFQIALANGITVDAMMAANDITDRTEPLRVGRRLAIPPR